MLTRLATLADQLEQQGLHNAALQIGSVVAASADDQLFDQLLVEAKGGWKQKVLPLMMGLGLGAGGVGMGMSGGDDAAPTSPAQQNNQQSGAPTEMVEQQSFSYNMNNPRLNAAAMKLGRHLAKYLDGGVDERDMNVQEAQADVLASFASVLAGKATPEQATQHLLRTYKNAPERLTDVILGIHQQVQQVGKAQQQQQQAVETARQDASGAGNSMVSSY